MRALSEITLPDMSGGLNTRDPEYEIADNQSPDMLNLWFKDKALCKRPGQELAVPGINGVHMISEEFRGLRIVHAGDKLYKWDEAGAKRYKGSLDASLGYPEYADEGDYYIASKEGVIEGVPYCAGDRIIHFPSYAQTETAIVEGTVITAGNAQVTITAAGLTLPVVVNVAVAEGDGAHTVAKKMRAALTADLSVTSLYTVCGDDNEVALRQITPETYDSSFNIGISHGTCAGLSDAPSSYGNTMWHKAVEQITPADAPRCVQDMPGIFVIFGDGAYYIDGAEVWKIDMDAGSYSAVEPYVPVVMINCRHDLSESEDNEPYNLLGGDFCVKYNGDAEAGARYYVSDKKQDSFKLRHLSEGMGVVDITSSGSVGWKVKKLGTDNWHSGTPLADSATDTIMLTAHGFSDGDVVQFGPEGGALPGGITNLDLAVYKLAQAPLDPAPPTVLADAKEMTPGTDYTFDNIAGTVTFLKDKIPGTGTNNVWITARKVIQGSKDKITGCKAAVAFGGESGGLTGGTRVFVTANPAYPLLHWHSDLGLHVGGGMRYFPDTGEEYLDQNGDPITAAAKMGSELVVFKKNSIFALRYAFDGQEAYFPVRECSNSVGCDIPGSVQLIDNRLVFANTKNGVNMLISTGNESEDLIKPLSANVNSLLLSESGLKDACSCDYDRYYWLCVNGRVYLWDYEQTPYYNYSDYEQAQKRLAWYRFGNIRAKSFCTGQTLYYGAEQGIVGMTEDKNDFDEAIEAHYKSKAFDLGSPNEQKTFMHLYPSFFTNANIKAKVTAESEDTDEKVSREFDIRSFKWDNFSWSARTWEKVKFSRTYSMRLGMKKVSYVQVRVSSSARDRDIGLSGLRITYYRNGKVKR